MIAARPLPTALHSYRALSKLIYQKTAPSSNAAWSWKETKSSPDAAAATRGVGACSQQFCAVPGGEKIFGSQWPAPQSKSMQKGRAQPEPGVCLDAAALSCAKLNEFRPFRTAGASCHSCWVPSASHSTLVGLGWSQCRLSLPSFPEMSSLLEKNLSFLSRLVLKVTRIGVEHLTLGGRIKRRERGECWYISKNPVPPRMITW